VVTCWRVWRKPSVVSGDMSGSSTTNVYYYLLSLFDLLINQQKCGACGYSFGIVFRFMFDR
jgi:hypothetical protein